MCETTKVFVGSLPKGTRPKELRHLFQNYGIVVECDVLNRCGFVHMKTPAMARDAINALNGKEFHGKPMVVEFGRPKTRSHGDWGHSSGQRRDNYRRDGGIGPIRNKGRYENREPPTTSMNFRDNTFMDDPYKSNNFRYSQRSILSQNMRDMPACGRDTRKPYDRFYSDTGNRRDYPPAEYDSRFRDSYYRNGGSSGNRDFVPYETQRYNDEFPPLVSSRCKCKRGGGRFISRNPCMWCNGNRL